MDPVVCCLVTIVTLTWRVSSFKTFFVVKTFEILIIKAKKGNSTV